MSPMQRAMRNLLKHKPGLTGLAVVIGFALLAALAPMLAPADPFLQNTEAKFLPPFWMDGGSWVNPLGTDILGRDVLSRLLYGARLSLVIGFISVLVGASVGVPIGMISGYVGGIVDTIVM